MKSKFLCVVFLLALLSLTTSAFAQNATNETQLNTTVAYNPEIFEEFNSKSEVEILVKLASKDAAKVDEVLSTLPETEFKLRRKLQSGRGFSGNVTLSGFNLLINNSNINGVYLNKPLYVVNGDEGVEESEPELTTDGTILENLSTIEVEPKEQESLFSKLIRFLKSLLHWGKAEE